MSTEYDVILTEVPDDKEMPVVKIIYRILGLSPKDAKNLVKSAPIAVMERVSTQEAETFQRALEEVGAKVNIRKTASFKHLQMNYPLNAFELDAAAALDKYYSALASIDSKHQELLKAQNELIWYEGKLQEADELAIQLDLEKPSKLSVGRLPLSTLLTRSVVQTAITNARSKVTEHKNVQKLLRNTISRLQKEFDETMSRLRKQRDDTISRLQKEFDETMSRLRKQRDDTISRLQKEFDETMSHLHKQRDDTISRLQKEFDETMSHLHKQRDDTISRLQKEFDETMSRLRKQRDDTISRLQKEFQSTTSSLNNRLKTIEIDIQNNIKSIDNLKTKRMIEILLIIVAGIGSALFIRDLFAVVFAMLLVWGIRSYMK